MRKNRKVEPGQVIIMKPTPRVPPPLLVNQLESPLPPNELWVDDFPIRSNEDPIDAMRSESTRRLVPPKSPERNQPSKEPLTREQLTKKRVETLEPPEAREPLTRERTRNRAETLELPELDPVARGNIRPG